MAVTSIRLNDHEERMLAELREHYHCDASTILKRGLYELAEDASDNRIAERFEKNAKT